MPSVLGTGVKIQEKYTYPHSSQVWNFDSIHPWRRRHYDPTKS